MRTVWHWLTNLWNPQTFTFALKAEGSQCCLLATKSLPRSLPCLLYTCPSLHLECFDPCFSECFSVLWPWEDVTSPSSEIQSNSPAALLRCLIVLCILTYCPTLPNAKTHHSWNYAFNVFWICYSLNLFSLHTFSENSIEKALPS